MAFRRLATLILLDYLVDYQNMLRYLALTNTVDTIDRSSGNVLISDQSTVHIQTNV